MVKKKCIVMFSGGLDSRLAIKIMQKKGHDILAVFFKLPFGTGCCNEGCSFNFSQLQGIKLKIFDCTKGKLLQEYLKVIKNAKHGRGAGVNPCIDCRIFMLKEVKKFADKEGIEFIATGEVTGQRPMSQHKKQINVIEEESGLKGRIIRPLIDFENISGRSRKAQMALAKKFKIKYPHPAGGCLLCEKVLRNRLKTLLDRGLNEEELNLVGIGRHFKFGSNWIVIGRDDRENKIIEANKAGKVIEPDYPAPSAVIMPATILPTTSTRVKVVNNKKISQLTINKVNKLISAYSKRGSLNERKKFERYKL
jgi:tRNA(Ile)-lysidine synthase TilS/MesJ